MTTQDHPLSQALTYTNVTENDHIWQRDSPASEESIFGRGQVSFSPPLKHITIQSTQELLENFDPLDVLDSASEKSASSTDTMIMMTTEEERKNSERIKSSLLDHELRKALGDTNLKQFHLGDKILAQRRSVPNNYVSCQQMLDNAKQFKEKLSLSADDGYSTDSRSNTTASISSPLSSSLSSLSTFEGSPFSGSNNPTGSGNQNYSSFVSSNAIMQRGPIQKGPNLLGNGRANVYKHGGPAVKRREVQMESTDNTSNLEDRLRALTTIEEEDSGLPVADRVSINRNGIMGKFSESGEIDLQHGVSSSPRDARYGKRTVENPNFGVSSSHDMATTGVTGFFRAVPVTVVSTDAPSHGTDEMGTNYYQKGTRSAGMSSSSPQANGDGWTDYTRFFEKDCDIPPHNIDPAGRGKFSNSSVDDVPDMDINRQIGTGSPANPRKQKFSFSREGDRMVIGPGVSESALNRYSPRDVSGQDDGFHRSSDDPGKGYLRSSVDLPTSHNGGRGFHQNARQHHVMSSMPDLRYQDPSWVQGPLSGPALREQPSSFQGYPFHHSHHPDQQHISGHRGNAYPHFDMQQQQQQLQQHPVSLPPFASRYLNQHPLHGASMDSLNPPINMPQDSGDTDPSSSYPEVVLRRSRLTSSARAAPNRPDRYSWQPGSSFDQQHLVECDKLNHMGLERTSLDLGNIPQLQKQIRATSEMCLQASRRHMFASSADIYKLFSGQKKPTLPPASSNSGSFGSDTRAQNYRHSFHATSGSGRPASYHMAGSAQDSPRTKPKLRVMMPSVSTAEMSSPGPVRANHNINIPPEAWTSVPSLPNSAASEIDRHSYLRHPQAMSASADLDRHMLQRPGSANADLGVDRPSFQRQSSGYSSETELQQIESNARAIKKLQKRQGKQPVVDNHPQEFIPLNRSIDHDSNTGTDNASDLVDNEPVYVNQSMLSRARTFDSLNRPSQSEWFTPTSTSIPQPPGVSQSVQHLPSHTLHGEDDTHPPHSSQNCGPVSSYSTTTTHAASKMNESNTTSTTNHNSTTSPYADNIITQHQVINFSSKPITITSHVPSSPYSLWDQNDIPRNGSSNKNSNNNNNNNSGNGSSSNNNRNSQAYPSHNQFASNPKSYADPQRVGPYGLLYNHSGSPHFNSGSHAQGGHSLPPTDQSFSQGGPPERPRRTSSNSSAQLSPVEIAQMLDVPFATNIISDEQGDRLSTLV